MPENPYTPPDAELSTPIQGPRRPVRGILYALAFDFIGTIVASIVMTILYGLVLAGRGLNESEIASALSSDDLFTFWGLLQLVVGLWFSFYSGIICIRVSNGDNLLYPAILAGIGASLVLVLSISSTNLGTLLALTVLGVGAVLIGAKTALADRTDSI